MIQEQNNEEEGRKKGEKYLMMGKRVVQKRIIPIHTPLQSLLEMYVDSLKSEIKQPTFMNIHVNREANCIILLPGFV